MNFVLFLFFIKLYISNDETIVLNDNTNLVFKNYDNKYYLYLCDECLITYSNEKQKANIDNTELDVDNKYCLYSVYYNGKCVLTPRNWVKSKAILYSNYKEILLCPSNTYPKEIPDIDPSFNFNNKYYCSENPTKIANCNYYKSKDQCLICSNGKKGYNCDSKADDNCELTFNGNEDRNHVCLKYKSSNLGVNSPAKAVMYNGIPDEINKHIPDLIHLVESLEKQMHNKKTYTFTNLLTVENNVIEYNSIVFTTFGYITR